MSVIAVTELSLTIGKNTLLDGVNFQINQGERTAIVGANGAGKTTLLRCLLGLVNPDHGEVILHGKNINSLSRSAISQSIAYVPQGLSGEIPFSVQDFILMSRYSHAHNSSGLLPKDHEGRAIAAKMMARVGIEHLANRSFNTLSGGEKQKASIAAALTQQTPILVLDEPAAHLDPKQQESIQEVLGEINQDKSIITVTHDINWAAMDFDRIIGMKNGQIIADLAPKSFMTTENLERIFEITWELYPHPRSGMPMVIKS